MKSGDPCPNCNSPLRPSPARRYLMPAVDAAGIAIGAVANILSSGVPTDPRTRKDDRYIHIKCRKCGATFPVTT